MTREVINQIITMIILYTTIIDVMAAAATTTNNNTLICVYVSNFCIVTQRQVGFIKSKLSGTGDVGLFVLLWQSSAHDRALCRLL